MCVCERTQLDETRVRCAAGPADEAIAAGVPVAVCSTSNERAVSTIVRVMLGPEVAAQMRVFAGDVVPKKKPDPAIYLLAAKELGVDPRRQADDGLRHHAVCSR